MGNRTFLLDQTSNDGPLRKSKTVCRSSPNTTSKQLNSNPFQIRKIGSFEELLTLESVWRELQGPVNVSNLGSSFTVARTAWETLAEHQDHLFGYNKELLILQIFKDGSLIGIAPFVKVIRDKGIGPIVKKLLCIEFLAHSLLARHFRLFSDIITNQPSSALTQAVLDWLYANEKFDVIHLAYIAGSSPNFDFSKKELLYALISSVVNVNQFPNYETYARCTYATSLKQNIRTAFNRASAQSLSIESTVEESDASVLHELKQIASTKLDTESYFEGGYYSFLEKLCLRERGDVVVLRANGEPIAYRVYLSFPEGRYALDTHRNWDFTRLELGALLIDQGIKSSFEKRVKLHCEGLFGGIHTERFATNLIEAYKFLSPGNTIWGASVDAAIRRFHQPEFRTLTRPLPIGPPE